MAEFGQRDDSGSASNLMLSGHRSGLTMASAGQICKLGDGNCGSARWLLLESVCVGAHLEAPDAVI